MSDDLQDAILRELERAYPAPVTLRSLRSLVASDEYTRDAIQQKLAQLIDEDQVMEIKEQGLRRYRRIHSTD